MKINYNNPETSSERSNVVPLSLEENEKAIAIMNALILKDEFFTNVEWSLLQRFVWHYENLNHFMSVHSGRQEVKDFWDQKVNE